MTEIVDINASWRDPIPEQLLQEERAAASVLNACALVCDFSDVDDVP